MSKRFGEGVTLQDMDAFAVNRTLAEMKEAAKREEKAKYRKLEKIKARLVYIRKTFRDYYRILLLCNRKILRMRIAF